MALNDRFRKIRLLLLDVDGVLTDGRLYFGPSGEVMKAFYVRDGYGIKLWHNAGHQSGIISGRDSDIVSMRAAELGMSFVYQGNDDKRAAFGEVLLEAGVSADEIAYIGDDTLDIPIFEKVGLAIAVADAHESAIESVHYVTKARGGRGAVREVIDMILGDKKLALPDQKS
jgi:3-deoxy-D-manno-octulosonate 8-phosphate phosphatase (KDO 8-P phosphatase)